MTACASSVRRISTVARPEKASRAKPRASLVPFEPLGEHGHKGHVERPFGKEAAEHVGQAEGHDIGLIQWAGAEKGEDHRVTHEAEDAAGHCPAANRQEATHEPDRLHDVALSAPRSMASRSFVSRVRCLLSAWNFRPNMSLT